MAERVSRFLPFFSVGSEAAAPAFLFHSILFYSILFYSTLFYSTLLYSTLLYSTLLYSTPLPGGGWGRHCSSS